MQPRLHLPGVIRPAVRALVGLPGRWVPYSLQKPALSIALNHALGTPLRHGELEFLQGAIIRIVVHDLKLDWTIKLAGDRLTPVDRDVEEDVRISGDGDDFLLLAIRRVDPDTLFFQRRIRVEGDTELGLGVKNTLDAMDWDDLPPALRLLLQGIARVVAELERRELITSA